MVITNPKRKIHPSMKRNLAHYYLNLIGPFEWINGATIKFNNDGVFQLIPLNEQEVEEVKEAEKAKDEELPGGPVAVEVEVEDVKI